MASTASGTRSHAKPAAHEQVSSQRCVTGDSDIPKSSQIFLICGAILVVRKIVTSIARMPHTVPNRTMLLVRRRLSASTPVSAATAARTTAARSPVFPPNRTATAWSSHISPGTRSGTAASWPPASR
jgi:hypothetical protein